MPREKNGDLWAITIRSTGRAECAGGSAQNHDPCQPSVVEYPKQLGW